MSVCSIYSIPVIEVRKVGCFFNNQNTSPEHRVFPMWKNPKSTWGSVWKWPIINHLQLASCKRHHFGRSKNIICRLTKLCHFSLKINLISVLCTNRSNSWHICVAFIVKPTRIVLISSIRYAYVQDGIRGTTLICHFHGKDPLCRLQPKCDLACAKLVWTPTKLGLYHIFIKYNMINIWNGKCQRMHHRPSRTEYIFYSGEWMRFCASCIHA